MVEVPINIAISNISLIIFFYIIITTKILIIFFYMIITTRILIIVATIIIVRYGGLGVVELPNCNGTNLFSRPTSVFASSS